MPTATEPRRPPAFGEATTPRHRAWSAGFDPDYWYAVEIAAEVPAGKVIEVRFQGTSVALFRGEGGAFVALEDRCAHRQVKLSDGFVHDCKLVCRYHGWTFDHTGRLAGILDDHSGRAVLKAGVRRYPCVEKYGLVFIFFGDPELATVRPLPHIPELEGEDPWSVIPISYTMRCHPTSYVNNVMDSTHVATLHTKYNTRSMVYGKVTHCTTTEDRVVVGHEIELDPRGMLRHILGRLDTNRQEAWYEYPYLHVHVGGVTALWNFMLPVDGRNMRLFLLSCARQPRIPFLGVRPPAALTRPFLALAKEVLVRPLFDEDVWSTEAEQLGYEAHFDQPEIDPHPSIRPCYELTARKWSEYLARSARA